MKSLLIYSLIFILFIFLFVENDVQQKHRLIKDLWNAGHLVLFGLISLVYFHNPKNASRSLLFKSVITTFFCLLVGTAIEFLQQLFNREFSYNDIINDVIGGYLGLCVLLITDSTKKNQTRIIASLLLIILALTGLRNFEKHLLDEYRIRKNFPVLADFESTLEETRWEYRLVNVNYSTEHVQSGEYALKAEFLTGRYPTISLDQLIKNWTGYHFLNFSVYNPQSSILNYTLMVFDDQHIKSGRRFNDRYNKKIQIQPGWNHINLPINDIRQAPKHRQIQLSQIRGLSLFTDRLKQPVTIYIDSIQLVK